ncbi:hypothetical protein C356_01787 [Cryptococcus neoformans c45]|nr:hypothetical protein C356_01787 [Cryptococcus neoformans var. grubii c45]
MLDLSVTPKHGNAGGRYFPHTGHLGVSPVVVQGKVATKLPPVCDPLLVKNISLRIKCTEYRTGGAFEGDLQNTLWEQSQLLLAPPDGEKYLNVGDWDQQFKMAIPIEAATQGRSTMCIREYKVVWRMEVAIEHKPIHYVGTSITKAFALNLQNHQAPPSRPLSPSPSLYIGSDAYVSNVCLNIPHGVFGPGDSFHVSLVIKPENPSTMVKKVTVVLERLIELVGSKSAGRRDSFNDQSPPKRRHIHSSRSYSPTQTSRLSSILRRSLSPRPPFHRLQPDPYTLIGPSIQHEGQVIRDKITESSSTDMTSGVAGFRCSLPMSLPRRTGKWALGETHQTGLVSMSYQLRASITLKGDRRSSPSKTFILPAAPIILISTSITERLNAVAAVEHKRKKLGSLGKGLYLHGENSSIVDSRNPIHRQEPLALSTVTSVATNIKPILLSPDKSQHPPPQSISFSFPSPPQRSPTVSSLPIQSLLNPESSKSPPNHQLPSPPPTREGPRSLDVIANPESGSLLHMFHAQGSGRRISSTTSEEEEVQPSRSRQKLRAEPPTTIAEFEWPSLPSLDTLGLGLPHVPEDQRPRSRPRTAPIHSTFAMSKNGVPPPLSGVFGRPMSGGELGQRPMTSAGTSRDWREEEDAATFAFALPKDKEHADTGR